MAKYRVSKGGKLIAEWDVEYTIRVAVAGVFQYATFGIDKNGKTIYSHFQPKWVDLNTVPSLEGITLDEAMKRLEKFSNRKPIIQLINGDLPRYYENPEYDEKINGHAERIENFIETEAIQFFDENVLPIIRKNNWRVAYSWMQVPVLCCKNENDEWDNVRNEGGNTNNKGDEILIEYLSYKFLRKTKLDNDEKVDLTSEDFLFLHKFDLFMRLVPLKHLENVDIYQEVK